MTEDTYDVVVVGAGPAGATAAALLAKYDRRVLLLERETFPRHHVGESTLQGVFGLLDKELGIGPRLKSANFSVKTGASFVWGRNRVPWSFHFASASDPDDLSRVGFEVERHEFDKILMEAAREHGAEVIQGANVADVQVAAGANIDESLIIYEVNGSAARRVRARYVIDASGLGAVAARRMRIHRRYEEVRNFAEYGYWSPARVPYTALGGDITEADASNLLVVHCGEYWIWFIPLKERVSVGVVSSVRAKSALAKGGTTEHYFECLRNSAEASELLARSSFDDAAGVRVAKDWSHISDRLCGPGWFLVGDAAAFVDPILASGVHLAVTFGLSCGRAVNSLLQFGPDSTWVYEWYESTYRASYEDFRRMADAWYAGGASPESWLAVARDRVSERLQAEVSESNAFMRLASGTLTSGEYRDRVCALAEASSPPTAYFSPIGNRFSYTVDARQTMAEFLVGFPSAMVEPSHDPTSRVQAARSPGCSCVFHDSRLTFNATTRVGVFSERGAPVLECALYSSIASPNLGVGEYAPVDPRLLKLLRAATSVAEMANQLECPVSSLAAYLEELVHAGLLGVEEEERATKSA